MRWWDGSQWTGATRSAKPFPSPLRIGFAVFGVFSLMSLIYGVIWWIEYHDKPVATAVLVPVPTTAPPRCDYTLLQQGVLYSGTVGTSHSPTIDNARCADGYAAVDVHDVDGLTSTAVLGWDGTQWQLVDLQPDTCVVARAIPATTRPKLKLIC